LPLLTIVMGNMTNTFGGFVSPDTPSVTAITSVSAFTSKVKNGIRLGTNSIGQFIGARSCVYWYQCPYRRVPCKCLLDRLRRAYFPTHQRVPSKPHLIPHISLQYVETNCRNYLQAVLRQNIAFFDRLGAGEVTNRISHDVDLIQDGISDKISITAQAAGTFFSGFIIAFTRSWKFTLVLSCILPTMVLIFGFGGKAVATLAGKTVTEYASAATIAEEVLSSVRTAQAFGTEERLAEEYDRNLVAAQKVGYKKAFVMACLFSGIFTLVYLAYGLAFCKTALYFLLVLVANFW
jgi:ABC transporter transmembrane region